MGHSTHNNYLDDVTFLEKLYLYFRMEETLCMRKQNI
jgi:hypothetical protein